MSVPDAQFHPHATGVAAETVAKHQDPQDVVFWAGWFCPFVQRVWIALEERGIPYQYKEVNPYKKEKHFLDINPKGLVPAVEYQGKALYESLVLLEFLEEAYPSQSTSLFPSDPYDRAIARLWIDHISKNYLPNNWRLTQSQTKEKQDEAREALYEAQRKLVQQVKGPYFFGEKFSIVDAVVAPWIARDWVITENRGYERVAVGEAWVKYAKALCERPSVKKTTSEREHYEPIYGRYLRDEAQSEVAKAVRSGKTLP
ncbi:Glutathione S-transferase omega-1 [Leucoagaricus sp. SymC.cos]|nr:Glutathione S-transferase omega-1 [Leucoagaricus sp. SymC.cos]